MDIELCTLGYLLRLSIVIIVDALCSDEISGECRVYRVELLRAACMCRELLRTKKMIFV